MIKELRFSKCLKVKTPHRGTPHSAGLDMFVPENIKVQDFCLNNPTISTPQITPTDTTSQIIHHIVIHPGESVLIPSGIHFDIPDGYMLKIDNKSSIASKKGLLVGANIIDQEYCGQLHLNLWNVSNKPQIIEAGTKLAQAIMIKVEYPEVIELKSTNELYARKIGVRGAGGFGSTGDR
jgi:dUTP pyrophosphatase